MLIIILNLVCLDVMVMILCIILDIKEIELAKISVTRTGLHKTPQDYVPALALSINMLIVKKEDVYLIVMANVDNMLTIQQINVYQDAQINLICLQTMEHTLVF